MDVPACPFHDSSDSWVERDSLRDWATKDQTLLRSLASSEREELKRTFAIDEEAELSRLLERALYLKDYVSRKRAYLSPQRLLCPELLSQVFIQLANEQMADFTFPYAFESPPAIFRVCKRWRQIARATGELFSCLEIRPRGHGALRPDCPSDQLRRWLLLSRRAPLNISYDVTYDTDFLEDERAQRLWSTLVQHFPRWQHMNCDLCSWSQIDEIRSIQMSSDTLESLTIDLELLQFSEEEPTVKTTTFAPLKLPHLKTMNITAFNVTDLSLLQLQFDMPLSTAYTLTLNLGHHKLQNEDVEVINSFLGKVTRLTIRGACVPMFHAGADLTPNCFRLPDLRFCEIKISYGSVCPCNFSGCSQLTSLSLDQDDLELVGNYPAAECTTVLRNVTTLAVRVWFNDGTEEAIYRCLANFPALENLDWTSTRDNPDSFNEYIKALKAKNCCPRLATLSFANGVMDRDELLDLVTLRSQWLQEDHALKFCITLSKCPHLPDVVLVDLARLRAEIGSHPLESPESDSESSQCHTFTK